jgi:protein ImuB
MRRVVSLFLPTWSTDRVRRKLGSAAPPAESGLVLIGRDGRRQVVLAADAAAQRAGLRLGMPATKAQALVPGPIFHNAEPADDAEALDRLRSVRSTLDGCRAMSGARRVSDGPISGQ